MVHSQTSFTNDTNIPRSPCKLWVKSCRLKWFLSMFWRAERHVKHELKGYKNSIERAVWENVFTGRFLVSNNIKNDWKGSEHQKNGIIILPTIQMHALSRHMINYKEENVDKRTMSVSRILQSADYSNEKNHERHIGANQGPISHNQPAPMIYTTQAFKQVMLDKIITHVTNEKSGIMICFIAASYLVGTTADRLHTSLTTSKHSSTDPRRTNIKQKSW